MARFQAAHHEILGDRLRTILKLRLRLLQRQIKAEPETQSAYDRAAEDFEELQLVA